MRLGARTRKMRFGRNDQSEGLKRRCHIDLRIDDSAARPLYFAEVTTVRQVRSPTTRTSCTPRSLISARVNDRGLNWTAVPRSPWRRTLHRLFKRGKRVSRETAPRSFAPMDSDRGRSSRTSLCATAPPQRQQQYWKSGTNDRTREIFSSNPLIEEQATCLFSYVEQEQADSCPMS